MSPKSAPLFSLHRRLWDSGSYLLIISAFNTIACFLPLVFNFGDIGRIKDNDSRSDILDTMNSKEYQFALIANIAVGIPVTIDYLIELFYGIMSKSNQSNRAHLPRIVLIISLVAPNFFILLVSIPLAYPELSVCFFMTRMTLLFYGVLGHLWIVGGEIFRSPWFLIFYLGLSTGILLTTYDTINAKQVTFLYWLALSFYSLSNISTTVFCLKYLRYIKKIGIRKMDVTQFSSLIYLIIFFVFGTYFYISGIIYRGDYGENSLIAYTYAEAAFTIMLTALQSYLTHYEKLMTKDVSILLCSM